MKKILSLILALSLVFCLFSVCGITASAAEAGTLYFDPIILTNGEWHTKYWTNSNYNLNCYNKITVPSRGYITFTIEKPYDAEGEIGSYDLELYDIAGNMLWAADTEAQANSFNANYTYKIGLDEGTYIMNLDPNFYVYSSSAPIGSSYKYTFTKTSYWEIENNNTQASATMLTLDKKYSGVYCEESYDTTYTDYFKFKLTKGCKYNIIIGNYSNLEADTLIEDLLDPYGNEVSNFSSFSGKDDGNSHYWTITAQYSGWYYLKFHNDGHDAGVQYTIKIAQQKISATKTKAKLSTTTYTYNGEVKKPNVKVTYGSKTLKKNTDYTVKYATGRKNPGKYKVTITFKGSYSGTKTLYFTINPAKTKVLKITPAKKSLKIYISKKSTQVSGYQIQYATNKTFKSAKTKNLTSYKTTSVTLKGLSAKKTYFVRVRTYKIVNGKKYYSAWSSIAYKKTK